LVVLDNEKISNEIFRYPDFFVDGTGLGPWPLKTIVSKNFLKK